MMARGRNEDGEAKRIGIFAGCMPQLRSAHLAIELRAQRDVGICFLFARRKWLPLVTEVGLVFLLCTGGFLKSGSLSENHFPYKIQTLNIKRQNY